jgi:hypothetical protein
LRHLAHSSASVSTASPHTELLWRIRAEFIEMPGLRLTARQAQCLFGLDADTCRLLLAELQDAKFLICTEQGLFSVDRGTSGKSANSTTYQG